ncbi:protein FAR1-RELATED SEQUENCE 5-like [Andrographis paniculata]|uniref:protein FAR1-RELATED SEQUENCE 5-like n=1 Tax=Andrographis paniculata TaxID=175694 RepID=UPI0021E91DF3|nr:protein FAR1-RELATED SEQUENCE 5-like [Andrographis paniculata]
MADIDEEFIDWHAMEFTKPDDAYNFYCEYAHNMGFSVRIKMQKKFKKDPQQIQCMEYCCNKAGFKEGSNVKPNQIHPNKSSESERIKIMHRSHETRTDCNSKIRLQFDKENAKYKVTYFEDNHNHDLHPPKHKHMLEAGLPIRSSYDLMKIAAGGKENVGFFKLDLKNHMKKRRKEIFKEDEANALLQYFGQRSVDNPLFFYEIEVDYEDKIANIL